MVKINISKLRNELRQISGQPDSYVLDHIKDVVRDWDGDELDFAKRHVDTVKALLGDSADKKAVAIGKRLTACRPSNPCRSVYCPYCRGKKQDKVAEQAFKHFGDVDKKHLRFVTIIHSIQTDLSAIPEACEHLRNQVRNVLNNHAPDVRLLGFLEVDLKNPDMYRGRYKSSHNVEMEHRPHAKALFKGLGLDLNDPTGLPPKFYLPHLHAIADVSQCAKNLNSDDVLKRAFPHPHQVRVSRLWKNQPKEDAIARIACYTAKFKLQFSDNIYADDPDKPIQSRYMGLYPDDEIRGFFRLANENGNLKMFKVSRRLNRKANG